MSPLLHPLFASTALLLLSSPLRALAADSPQLVLQQPPTTAPLAPLPLFDASAGRPPHASYIGCWNETSGFAANGGAARHTSSDTMTASVCFTYCRGGGDETHEERRRYAGLRDGRECHCFDAFSTLSDRLDAGSSTPCAAPCAGDPSTSCGGPRAFAVYDLTDFIAAVTTTTALAMGNSASGKVEGPHADRESSEEELQTGIAWSQFPGAPAWYGMLAAITLVIAAVI